MEELDRQINLAVIKPTKEKVTALEIVRFEKVSWNEIKIIEEKLSEVV